MDKRTMVALLAASWLGAACGPGLKVSTDYSPSTDFSVYDTFALMAAGERTGSNQLIADRIDAAVKTDLESKGLRALEADPDLVVAWHVVLDEKFDVTTTGTAYGGGYWGRYRGGMAVGTSQTTVNEWTQGTLIIDIIDRARDQLVYRASGQTEVKEDMAPDERTRRINDAVGKILADFPPSG